MIELARRVWPAPGRPCRCRCARLLFSTALASLVSGAISAEVRGADAADDPSPHTRTLLLRAPSQIVLRQGEPMLRSALLEALRLRLRRPAIDVFDQPQARRHAAFTVLIAPSPGADPPSELWITVLQGEKRLLQRAIGVGRYRARELSHVLSLIIAETLHGATPLPHRSPAVDPPVSSIAPTSVSPSPAVEPTLRLSLGLGAYLPRPRGQASAAPPVRPELLLSMMAVAGRWVAVARGRWQPPTGADTGLARISTTAYSADLAGGLRFSNPLVELASLLSLRARWVVVSLTPATSILAPHSRTFVNLAAVVSLRASHHLGPWHIGAEAGYAYYLGFQRYFVSGQRVWSTSREEPFFTLFLGRTL